MNEVGMFVLAGDIGGTKTHLGLFQLNDRVPQLVSDAQFVSRAFESLETVIERFLEPHASIAIDAACFGIAGPVINGVCRTTNLPWEVETVSLQRLLECEAVGLLNDLESTGYGMLELADDSFVELNPNGRVVKGNRAVIAAGTGLGEALLMWDGRGYFPVGSEGGHSDFAPVTAQQDALLQWLRQRFPGHVSVERILSGPGIYTIYQFLAESGYASEPDFMRHAGAGVDKSQLISQAALDKTDPLCQETLRLFVEIYAAEAGNLALKYLSVGGVYIGGGIAPKILPLLEDGMWLDVFAAKGRFEDLLRGMQVRVCLNPQTSLHGAAQYAIDKLLRH